MSTQTVTPASAGQLPPLIATSVVRGARQGQSHGGVFIIRPSAQSVQQVLDWNTVDIDWEGRGWDRGLRGIAFCDDEVYLAASDELFVYDRNFALQRSYRNPYLRHCHEIAVFGDTLHVTSTGFDSILGFDLKKQAFSWGIQAVKLDGNWYAHRFDAAAAGGPAARNSLHINNVQCDREGLTFSGLRTEAIVGLGAEGRLLEQVTLPSGTHNARLFRDGVLFNDTAADHLRFITRGGTESRFRFPRYPDDEIVNAELGDERLARQGFGRGLAVIDERLVAAGSSPSTVSVFDLDSGATVLSVNFSMDIRNAIHGLAVWPYD